MFSLIVRPKPCAVLITLRDTESNWHLSKIAKASDTTYVYVTKLIYKMEAEGIVIVESKGKKRLVRLTEKGKRIADLAYELIESLDGSQ